MGSTAVAAGWQQRVQLGMLVLRSAKQLQRSTPLACPESPPRLNLKEYPKMLQIRFGSHIYIYIYRCIDIDIDTHIDRERERTA